jgi:hypothetical protein
MISIATLHKTSLVNETMTGAFKAAPFSETSEKKTSTFDAVSRTAASAESKSSEKLQRPKLTYL